MSGFWRLGLLTLLVAGFGRSAFCADDDAKGLAKAVADSVAAYTKAAEARDAKALSELFTPQGEYVDSEGIVFHGRAAIEAEFAAGFQVGKAGDVDVEVISIRPIAEGVLIEEGVSTFTPKDQSATTQTRYSATHVRTDGKWMIASVRELASAESSPHERLKSLSWLIGSWRQETGGALVNTEWRWSADGNFLVAEFSSQQSADESLAGSHRVGWDAERGQFRSWVFTSTGGSADGWWTQSAAGDWSVQLSGVEATGDRMSLVLSYKRDGKDAMVISQSQRSVGGSALPAIESRVVRQPPAPAKQSAAR